MENCLLNDSTVDFKRSKQAKKISIQVKSNFKILLIAPYFISKKKAFEFLYKNIIWINSQMCKIKEQKKIRPNLNYNSGDKVYYFGEQYILNVIINDKKKSKVKLYNNEFRVYISNKIEAFEISKNVKIALENFYKTKASEVIYDRLEFFNEYYKLQFNKVYFKNQKTRWGSCSSLKNLNYNWRLIMAPIEIIDYIVVHELCHLKEMNHSNKFWNLVAEQIPNYKENKRWLKENHFLLEL